MAKIRGPIQVQVQDWMPVFVDYLIIFVS